MQEAQWVECLLRVPSAYCVSRKEITHVLSGLYVLDIVTQLKDLGSHQNGDHFLKLHLCLASKRPGTALD